ncbi:hypothetical protein MTO96_003754 [Rhipicephalus appendiculatus]
MEDAEGWEKVEGAEDYKERNRHVDETAVLKTVRDAYDPCAGDAAQCEGADENQDDGPCAGKEVEHEEGGKAEPENAATMKDDGKVANTKREAAVGKGPNRAKMTVHLRRLFVNTLFFVAAGAYRGGTIMLPGSTREPDFPQCGDVDDIVGRCRDKMASFLHRSRGGRSVDESGDFEHCLLHRQELTLREYAAWCEHKSSVARKIARSLSKSVVSKGIQRLQDCINGKQEESKAVVMEETMQHSIKQSHEEEPAVERRPKNPAVIGEHDHDYDISDREAEYESEEHERPFVVEEPHHRDTKHRHKRIRQPDEKRNKGTWSYPIHDQSYYYPRREKGLGNETAQSPNTTVEIPSTPIEAARPMTKPLPTAPSATTQK